MPASAANAFLDITKSPSVTVSICTGQLTVSIRAQLEGLPCEPASPIPQDELELALVQEHLPALLREAGRRLPEVLSGLEAARLESEARVLRGHAQNQS